MHENEEGSLDRGRTETERETYLTTGQAAALCSVTPDTVLKWVNSGKLPARRTAGGHCRIARRALMEMLAQRSRGGRAFSFCWEYYSKDGRLAPECSECLVFLARASRCYELARRISRGLPAKFICQGPCEECAFYHMACEREDQTEKSKG